MPDDFDTRYPESAKLRDCGDEFSTIIEFIEWAESQGFVFAQQSDTPLGTLRLTLSTRSPQVWAETFFNIDRKALELEQREMLKRVAELTSSLRNDP